MRAVIQRGGILDGQNYGLLAQPFQRALSMSGQQLMFTDLIVLKESISCFHTGGVHTGFWNRSGRAASKIIGDTNQSF